ncbi:MAG: cAMP-binding protein [Chloroflexi bacterium]|nr:cAMP-binding protein [Chloroflexota bacterium]
MRRGDAGGRLFVIVRGQVSVTLPSSEGPELRLGTLKAGEVFGEMSVFDDEPRSATVTAIEPTETLSLNTTQVLAFLGEHPEAAIAIIRLLVRRLRDTNTLAESVRADASAAEARRARSSPSG